MEPSSAAPAYMVWLWMTADEYQSDVDNGTPALKHLLPTQPFLWRMQFREWLGQTSAGRGESSLERAACEGRITGTGLWGWGEPTAPYIFSMAVQIFHILQPLSRWETLVRERLVARWHSTSQRGQKPEKHGNKMCMYFHKHLVFGPWQWKHIP